MYLRIKSLVFIWLLFPWIVFAEGGLSIPTTPCSKTHEDPNNRKQCNKTWTVLVYMSVTKDLIPYSIADRLEMELPKSGSSPRSDVIVQVNHGSSQRSQRFQMLPNLKSEAQVLSKADLRKLSESQLLSPKISDFELNPITSELARFEEFLTWGMQEFPSKHYLVILWGHGNVWTGISPALDSEPDSKPEDNLSIQSIRHVLKKVKKWRGESIDILAEDACHMQHTEAVIELCKYSKYICGSEDIESYAGFPYDALLSSLNSGDFEKKALLASKTIQSYDKTFVADEAFLVAWLIPYLYQNSFDQQNGSQRKLDEQALYDLTHSAVITQLIRSHMISALNHLGTALSQAMQEKPERKYDLRSLIRQEKGFRGDTQDLGLFLDHLSRFVQNESQTLPLLSLAIEKTKKILNDVVINFGLGRDYETSMSPETGGSVNARGLSIWLPKTREEYTTGIHEFKTSKLFKIKKISNNLPGWAKWLEDLYNESGDGDVNSSKVSVGFSGK